ncbi:MAG: hypothetical protein JNK97_09335 [Zoogloea sp.]|nr:hypothetical protein [Zoogloea sp.]
MNQTLDAASAWFFESASHTLNGSLKVDLVEGTHLRPYFPVTVEPNSRCVRVVFPACRAFFVFDETLDQLDPELKKKEGRIPFEAESSSFRDFAEARTTVAEQGHSPSHEFVLCCEDKIIHVLSSSTQTVQLLNQAPDLQIQRTQTWSAS